MLTRIPEKEIMDDWENVAAYANADFSAPHDRFVELFLETFPYMHGKRRVLDLGCGAADITMRFANALRQCSIDAVDASFPMLQYARSAIAERGFTKQITFFDVRLPMRGTGVYYDIVISNSLLHHLANPFDLWDSLPRVARPGSAVFIMDLLRPETEQQVDALTRQYAGNESEILQTDFYNSLRAAYTVEEIAGQLGEAGLGMLKVQRCSDRHVLIYGDLIP